MNNILNTNIRKIDFHIHTPKSACYSEKSVDYPQIVEAAVASQLDAIAITDHNTAAGIDAIRSIASLQGLVVFPGMELTTKSGHFLAIFDVDTPVARLHGLLDDIGVKPAIRGDGAEPVPGETLDVLQKVHNYGGLVIAAHIERWPSGFLESKESRAVKSAIHASSCLNALEISVAQDRSSWENGLMRGYGKKYACVQGSDAHTPVEIGRRPVYIRLPEINLVSLQTVFQNWQGNIAFSEKEFENGIH